MMVNDAELETTPQLDDVVMLHMGNSAGADAAVAYRIEDGPLPGGGWFIMLADEQAHGAPDWAATIQDNDIQTITRLIDSGVMQWQGESQMTERDDATGGGEPDIEHGVTESGVVLLPRATGHDDRRDEGANDDN